MRRSAWVSVVFVWGCAQTVSARVGVGADGGAPDVAAPDVATVCVPTTALDGASRGVRVEGEVHYGVRADEMSPGPLAGDDDGCGPRGTATRGFALRWVTATAARVRVVVVPAQDGRVERAVLTVGCGEGLRRLACAALAPDDTSGTRSPEVLWSESVLPAGTELTLRAAAEGDVVVRVAEVAVQRAAGERCDPLAQRDVCEPGARCVDRVCRPTGASRSACRRGAPPCDEGLQCFGGTALGAAGVCLRAVPLGGACARADGCVGGACVRDGDVGVCRAAGDVGTPCRPVDPRCAAGLSCVRTDPYAPPRCLRTLPRGAACEGLTGAPCDEGTSCVGPRGAATCEAHGAQGGRCGVTAPRCGAGLTCGAVGGSAVCVPGNATVLGEGAVCSGLHRECAAGLTCASSVGEPRCVGPGALAAPCRALPPYCDGASFCDLVAAAPTCLAVHPRGGDEQPCRAWGEACAPGLTCVDVGFTTHCATITPRGAECSELGPTCAPGSQCMLDVDGRARCLDDGTLAPPCGPAGACAAGRVCDAGLCRPRADLGARCYGAWVCPSGASCVGATETVFGGSCVRDGATYGACRRSGAACDAGARCVGYPTDPDLLGLCVPVSGLGGACRDEPPRVVCDVGLRCEQHRCVADAP